MFKGSDILEIFKVLSTLKFYWLEVGKWKEGEMGSEEEARVFFMNMQGVFLFCLVLFCFLLS